MTEDPLAKLIRKSVEALAVGAHACLCKKCRKKYDEILEHLKEDC